MGHGTDPARAALGTARALLVALVLIAACGPAPSTHPAGPQPVLVVAVTGLQADDPVLDTLPSSVFRSTNTVASGTGAAASLELLDGRTALEQLREPRDPLAWARTLGWSCRIDVMDPSLRSEPEWVHSFADWEFRETLPEPGHVDLHVVIARRDQLDEHAFLDLLAKRGDAPVIVAGIPDQPTAREDAEQVVAHFRVPVLLAGRGSMLTDPRTLADVLAPMRGEVRRAAERVAHWWNDQDGGVIVERGGGWVVGGSDREPVAVGNVGDVDPAALIDDALVAGSLLVMLRGSEAADLTALDLLTSSAAEWSPWGLEPIDTAEQPSPRYLRLELAAEPEGDGILIANAHRQKIDVRLLVALEDAPVIGAPVRDASTGHGLGIDAIRLSPWSRNYWRLTRPAPFDTATWWPKATAGIDLLWVREGTGPPAPVLFED